MIGLAGLAAAADLGMGSHATERLSGKGGNGDSVMILGVMRFAPLI